MPRTIESHAVNPEINDSAADIREESLDPIDWKSFRSQAHRMLDDMLNYTEHIRERPVWQPIPHEVRSRLRASVPGQPADLASVHEEFLRNILPFAVGNVHPGFMGWAHGGGTPVGMLAEMLAAGLNANLGGRDQAPIEVERQIVQWTREIFGFPDCATGLFVTGTSMANFIAVTIARDVALGFDVRTRGVAAQSTRLTAYASTAVHSCIAKAMDLAGLGSGALRLIPTDDRHRIDLAALESEIQQDRDAGTTPFLVVGTAGTVDTGAIDNLSALAGLSRRENIWFHVDGACGALARLAPDLAPKLAGIERADSLAFDFHKWGQVPYDAGFILVRDGQLHKNSFASQASYLQRAEHGLAAGSPWPCDFGPDLSRGFRALKTWFTLKVHGTAAVGAAISRTCQLARYLETRISETPELELLAPVELNIVCFRYRAKNSDQLNKELVIALQESGIAAPSTTRIENRIAIRAAIFNHRTRRSDIDALVEKTLALGRSLQNSASQSKAPAEIQKRPSPAALQSSLQTVERHLASRPRATALHFRRAALLEQQGQTDEAVKAYLELLSLDSSHLGALLNLGSLLLATGKKTAARTAYSQAVANHPDDLASRVKLAALLVEAHEPAEARKHLEHALTIDPDSRQAHAGMSFALADLADTEQSSRHRRAAYQDRCVVPVPYFGDESHITVLELVSNTAGDTRFNVFLNNQMFQKYFVATEFYNSSIPLPPHELVAHTSAPVINPPTAVLATGRCEVARRLSGVPGVVAPRTITLSRQLLAPSDATITLSRHGFTFPILLRTPGFHGGEHFLKVNAPEELPSALENLPGRDLVVIQFLDAQSADGKIRKYRVMMIDGQLYPLHLAIARDWKIHFHNADMADSPEHRAEDAAFLADMHNVLGPRAIAALQFIQKSLALDYGGIDFALNATGEVLLFEANATMAIVPPDADARWDYRRPAVDQIYRAVMKLLFRIPANVAV
jgi:aromatic-L-amino-acid decarboxylase